MQEAGHLLFFKGWLIAELGVRGAPGRGGARQCARDATNVALHLLAALTLFGVLRRTFAVSIAEPHTSPSADVTAAVCALIWVVHPLNSEAVDYLAQRRESMAGMLWLLTLYAAIRAWRETHSRRWQALAVLRCWF